MHFACPHPLWEGWMLNDARKCTKWASRELWKHSTVCYVASFQARSLRKRSRFLCRSEVLWSFSKLDTYNWMFKACLESGETSFTYKILDEIDRVGLSRMGGHFAECLLGFWRLMRQGRLLQNWSRSSRGILQVDWREIDWVEKSNMVCFGIVVCYVSIVMIINL